MAINNAAAAFIGASITLVLVIVFMILMVILVRQCLAFLAKRSAIRNQVEAQRQARAEYERRRGSVTEPVPATFDWHHSIRIAGTPPPTYHEAKKLPAFEEAIVEVKALKKGKKVGNAVDNDVDSSDSEDTVPNDSPGRRHTANSTTDVGRQEVVEVSIVVPNGHSPAHPQLPGPQADSHDTVRSDAEIGIEQPVGESAEYRLWSD